MGTVKQGTYLIIARFQMSYFTELITLTMHMLQNKISVVKYRPWRIFGKMIWPICEGWQCHGTILDMTAPYVGQYVGSLAFCHQ